MKGAEMRIVVIGQAAFGLDVFNALREAGEEIVGVSTPRQKSRPDPLFEAAGEAGIPVVATPDLRKDEPFAQYLEWKPDLLVFAFVTDIVRKRVLDASTHGAIQYHPSLLPKHRGRSAMNWPIMSGSTKTGNTIFWVDEGIDTGPILSQEEFEIEPEDTMGSLYFQKLYPAGIKALADGVRQVREGTAPRIKQDDSQASYEPPAGPEHSKIDFQKPGPVVFNLVRGLDPSPGASAQDGERLLRLYDASYRPGSPDEDPGTVVSAADGSVEIAVIGGFIIVARAQLEGERKAAAADLLEPGTVLDRPA
jgi:methionyl-tRNA formyltransferase